MARRSSRREHRRDRDVAKKPVSASVSWRVIPTPKRELKRRLVADALAHDAWQRATLLEPGRKPLFDADAEARRQRLSRWEEDNKHLRESRVVTPEKHITALKTERLARREATGTEMRQSKGFRTEEEILAKEKTKQGDRAARPLVQEKRRSQADQHDGSHSPEVRETGGCKERPTENRKRSGSGGKKREFIPWCHDDHHGKSRR